MLLKIWVTSGILGKEKHAQAHVCGSSSEERNKGQIWEHEFFLSFTRQLQEWSPWLQQLLRGV